MSLCALLPTFNQGYANGLEYRLEMIDHYVTRGSHYVECQLLGEEDDRNVPPFKIIGVFST